MKNGVHHGRDLELKIFVLSQTTNEDSVAQACCEPGDPVYKDKPSGHVLRTLQKYQSGCQKPIQHRVTIV